MVEGKGKMGRGSKEQREQTHDVITFTRDSHKVNSIVAFQVHAYLLEEANTGPQFLAYEIYDTRWIFLKERKSFLKLSLRLCDNHDGYLWEVGG